MSSFTCNTCGLQFPTSTDQKDHMRSDWHRYNLKRRVAQLPSISYEIFEEKVNSMKQEEDNGALNKKQMRTKRKEEIQRQKLELIRKAMAGREAAGAGEEAEKEIAIVKEDKIEEDKKEDTTEEDKNEDTTGEDHSQNDENEEEITEKLLKLKLKSQVEIPPTACLFCRNRSFSSIELNVNHMFKNHGLFIPEQKYLVDLEGLLKYLGEKVGLGNVCLVCNYQGKNIEAVRAHMESKSHCQLPYDNEEQKLEISDFYDFSSTYGSNESVDGGDHDDQWEDVSEDDDETSDSDYEIEKDYLYSDGVELYLPTGIKIGHRSLQRYFKQDLKPEKVLSEGQGTVISAETRHMLSVVEKKQIAVQKRAWKTEMSDKKRNDKRAAKFINNQPHFRDPLLQ